MNIKEFLLLMVSNKRSEREISLFSFKLGELLEAGFPLMTALSIVQKSSSKRINDDIQFLLKHLDAGQSLSSGIKHLRFPSFYCFTLLSAECHGQYTTALHLLGTYYSKRVERKKKQRKMLAYPLFILLSSMFTFFLFMDGLIPQFVSLYQSFSLPLPWITQAILTFSTSWSKHQGWIYGLLAVLLVIMCWMPRYQRLQFEKLLLGLPYFSHYFKLHLTSTISLQIGYLLEGGISILEVCQLLSKEGHWQMVCQTFQDVNEDLLKGVKLSEAFSSPLFLPVMKEMVSIAEEAGTLGVSLQRLGQHLEIELDQWVERQVSFLENGTILGSGFIVFMLMLALFLPMLEFIGQL